MKMLAGIWGETVSKELSQVRGGLAHSDNEVGAEVHAL